MKWLLKWLLERVEPAAAPFADYGGIPGLCGQAVQKHVSTFPMTSGANCFSAAAGAYLGSSDIMEQWLDDRQFNDILFRESLVRCDEVTRLTDIVHLRPHDVLVWENGDGKAVHAAYAVSEQRLFNKMGQFWFQPWQYAGIEQVLDYAGCLSNGGRIGIYRSEK